MKKIAIILTFVCLSLPGYCYNKSISDSPNHIIPEGIKLKGMESNDPTPCPMNSYFDLIIEGMVGCYSKGVYDMGESEGWKRVDVNGGFGSLRKGFLHFENNKITFVQGSSDTESEVYMSLNFRYEEIKKTKIMSEALYTSFKMKDKDDNQISIDYFSSNYFVDSKAKIVISDYKNQKMYFFICDDEIASKINSLYE